MVVLLVCSMIFQFLAAYLSVRFVLLGRLGRPWLLVSSALLIAGGLRGYSVAILSADPASAVYDPTVQVIEFAVSFLMGVGFALTERWYLLRERLEGRFRMITDIDRALVGVLDEEKILSTVCEGLARGRGYRLAFIGSAEPDGSVRVVKKAGEGEGFLSEVPLRWDEAPGGGCPPGAAIRTGDACVANRISDDPNAAPWKDAAGRFGLESCASVRIDVKKSPPLALTIASGQRDAFDRLEMEALQAMACRVGTAVFSSRRHELFVCAKKSYGDLLKSQRDGVLLVRGGTIVRVNPACVRILGYSSAEEILGKDPSVIFPDAGGSSRVPRPSTLEPEDRTAASITEMRRKDGTVFEGEVSATWIPRPFRNEEWDPEYSGPIGMIVFRDVTFRIQTLEELRKERDFSAKVLDLAGVLVLQVGPDGEILLFNRQCEEATGYSASEAVGRRMPDFLVPPSAQEFHRRSFESIWNGQIPLGMEYELVTKSGEERLVVWNYAAIPGPDGKTGSVIAAGTDVTERRRLEKAIIGMQKLEAVGTLAGGIAHDFNNILTGIFGNLDLARKILPPGSAAMPQIEESIQASERAAQLIRQLLEFSRRSPIEQRATDMKTLVKEVVHLFSQTIDRRIEVGVSMAEDLWLATADSSQVHQVVMNLCVNARDAIMERLESEREGFRGGDGAAIRVSAGNVTIGEEYCRSYPYARRGEFVVLSIADNGVGMDEGTQRRVFEPFFTTKKLGRGTGLGLSTVYGIVKQHGGWITLDSEPGTGTTFRCYFPRSGEAEPETADVPETGRSMEGRETILLVDDEEMIRDLGRRILEAQGYTVLTARDGQQAMNLFSSRGDDIELVILDLTMPQLSGLEVLERIRKVKPGAKVVLSSGYRAGEVHSPERLSEASAFLPKPYRPDVLARLVRDVLNGETS